VFNAKAPCSLHRGLSHEWMLAMDRSALHSSVYTKHCDQHMLAYDRSITQKTPRRSGGSLLLWSPKDHFFLGAAFLAAAFLGAAFLAAALGAALGAAAFLGAAFGAAFLAAAFLGAAFFAAAFLGAAFLAVAFFAAATRLAGRVLPVLPAVRLPFFVFISPFPIVWSVKGLVKCIASL